jgi:cyanate lyase
MTTIRDAIVQLTAAAKAEKRARSKLARALRRGRQRRQLSLRAVAAVLGCSSVFVHEMESGKRAVPDDKLRALATLLEPGRKRSGVTSGKPRSER